MTAALEFIHGNQVAISLAAAVTTIVFALWWVWAMFSTAKRLRDHAAVVEMRTEDLRLAMKEAREELKNMRVALVAADGAIARVRMGAHPDL